MGLGAAEAVGQPGAGRVIAVFRHACYLRFGGHVLALTTPKVPIGPVHLRSSVSPGTCVVGASVVVADGCLRAGDQRLSLTGAGIWRGPLPGPDAVTAHPHLIEQVLGAPSSRSALHQPIYRPRLQAARAAVAEGDLAAACRLLGGLGPGLTPSGDDALAGLLLAARLRSPATEDHLVRLARGVDSHQISRSFLLWAARGQSLEPVHRCLMALGAGDARAASAAAADLAAWGHTSGADLMLGLHLGLTVPRAALGSGSGSSGHFHAL